MNQKRIRLRALEPEDLDELYQIENDRRLWDVGLTNVPYSRFALHEYIANSANDIYADKQLRLIIETEGKSVAGIVDMCNYDPRHNRAEVGIVIKSSFRNQGMAHEALEELHRYAGEVLGIYQLYAVVSDTNEHSLHLFKSLGYQHTATLKQWLCSGDDYQDALLLQKKIKK